MPASIPVKDLLIDCGHIRLKEEVRDKARLKARQAHISFAEYVRDLIEEDLEIDEVSPEKRHLINLILHTNCES